VHGSILSQMQEVEINLEPTPLTVKADFALHGRAGEILPALVKAVWNNKNLTGFTKTC